MANWPLTYIKLLFIFLMLSTINTHIHRIALRQITCERKSGDDVDSTKVCYATRLITNVDDSQLNPRLKTRRLTSTNNVANESKTQEKLSSYSFYPPIQRQQKENLFWENCLKQKFYFQLNSRNSAFFFCKQRAYE